MNTKITKKLEQLKTLLNQIDEVRAVNPDDPETWDSDTLYNLVENCKAVIKLLEDEKHPREKDPFGEPLILEEGLCSLVDEWSEKEEGDNF